MARRIPKNRFDQLVRAATEVFIATGYRQTQLSDVAREVGVAKGTLYGYVESKDALLALCLIHGDQIGPISLPEVARVEDSAAKFREVAGEFFDLMHANRHGIKLLDRCVDHPEIRDLWQTAGREQSRLVIARYLEARSRSGQFRPIEDIQFPARLLIETVATWAVHIHWDRLPVTIDLSRAREHTIDFLAQGFLA
ncbi:MAG TPA: TetR/AcrR family transcriptional regulator [Myxococcales bacterium]|nr:TetR/AcrR family transcriptional regulator [Myxococcales bacterium]HIK85674.1 TetR/AcrR family transcriptional regulator [Myxococcales bacterium]